jgi:hypothetical protein
MRAMALAIAFLSCIVITGCGGGGSSVAQQSVTTIPEGAYYGKTSNGRTIAGFILDDGSYWVLYSGLNPSFPGGLIQGTGTASNGNFSSTNGKDYSFEGLGILPVNVSATYVLAASLNGNMKYPSLNQTSTFTTTYDKSYETSPSLAVISGTYTGSALGDPTTISIANSGSITGKDSAGCTFSGTTAPRSKGNIYNTSITFGGYPCQFINTKWSGIAFFDASSKTIYAISLNSSKDNATVFSGTKP